MKLSRRIEKDDTDQFVRTLHFEVEDRRGGGDVNFRMGPLAPRADNRYPGDWSVHRSDEDGLVLTFNGTQHNSKPVEKIIPVEMVDKFILSCLECRVWE